MSLFSNAKETLRLLFTEVSHDEQEKCQIGDVVRIAETRPISKLKRWRVAEIIGLTSKEIESEIKDELS